MLNYLPTILLINISKLMIKNITIAASHNAQKWIPLTIKDCSFVSLYHLEIYQLREVKTINEITIVAINIMGNSYFSYLRCYYGRIKLFYNETHIGQKHNNLSINNCTLVKTVVIWMIQTSYKVTLRMLNMQVKQEIYEYVPFILGTTLGMIKILLINC